MVRRQLRNGNGRTGNEVEYTIYEKPKTPPTDTGFSGTASPCMDFLDTATPDAENQAQLNTKKTNSRKKQNTYPANTHSFCPQPPPGPGSTPRLEGMTEVYEKRDQIEYDLIADSANRKQINELVEIMLEAALNRASTMKIGWGAEHPAALIQQRFELINSSHIEKVLDGIQFDFRYLPCRCGHNPYALPSRSASSCRRCVSFSGGVSIRNWSTDIL